MESFDFGTTVLTELVIPNQAIIGGFLVLLAFILRGRAVDNEKAWKTAKSTIQPTLKALDPPVIQTYNGFGGCLVGTGYRLLALVVLLMGIDFVVFSGAVTHWVIRNSILNRVFQL